jgi:hypothetical protein
VSDPAPSSPDAREGVRRFLTRRAFWHTLGLVLAIALAWLLLRSYRQPELMLNLISVLC